MRVSLQANGSQFCLGALFNSRGLSETAPVPPRLQPTDHIVGSSLVLLHVFLRRGSAHREKAIFRSKMSNKAHFFPQNLTVERKLTNWELYSGIN